MWKLIFRKKDENSKKSVNFALSTSLVIQGNKYHCKTAYKLYNPPTAFQRWFLHFDFMATLSNKVHKNVSSYRRVRKEIIQEWLDSYYTVVIREQTGIKYINEPLGNEP